MAWQSSGQQSTPGDRQIRLPLVTFCRYQRYPSWLDSVRFCWRARLGQARRRSHAQLAMLCHVQKGNPKPTMAGICAFAVLVMYKREGPAIIARNRLDGKWCC